MRIVLIAFALLFFGCGDFTLTAAAEKATTGVNQIPLFLQGKTASPERYQFALKKKARFLPTPDGKSFYILWLPENLSRNTTPPVVFTLHGHGSWAFDEFFLWQPFLQKRGYGIIALQWWFGAGEKMADYYLPQQINEIAQTIFAAHQIRPLTVLAHGFSRGSANIYGVTAFDRASSTPYFLLTIANAGKAGADFPVNRDIGSGRFGPEPFAGTHWITCAGALDPHPDRDGIAGMREAQQWVREKGGVVDLAIEDPKGDHGCFHRNPTNINAALDVFAKLLQQQK